ncbi:hypothetical protein CRM22_005387 [Opisthorchis felineus]|uniref:Uncharacterized protein n=1 Tax=Opisthorchis felineus TaxID=147828 RepID=A0A4S2LRC2_OPIFE|nr:hypothetical protein CRM22_005387 [Opisthorchis felineus]
MLIPERTTNDSMPISTSTMDPFWYVPPDQLAGLIWTNNSMLENGQEKLENVNENLFFWMVVAVYSTCVNVVISLLCHLSKCLVMPKTPKMATQVRLDQRNSGVRSTYYRIPIFNWIMSKAVSRDSGKSSWQCTVRTDCCVYQAVYTCGACHLKRPQSQSSLDYVIRTSDPRGVTALESTDLDKLESSEAANGKRELDLDQPASSLLQVPNRSANRVTTRRQNVPILPRVALFFVHLLAVLDIIQVICDYIFPFILRSPQVENMIPSRMRYHLDCHLRIMLSMPTRFVVEWTLVVYGVERLITTIRRKPLFRAYPKRVTDHVEMNALKVKIGMSLFIVIMFAACSNYFIIVGQPTALIDATGKKYRRLIVSCNIRKEFQQLNTRVLNYVKLFLFTCIPQLITLVCLTSIAFIWSLHRIFFQTALALPQTDVCEFDSPNYLFASNMCTAMFCVHGLLRLGFQSLTNLKSIGETIMKRSLGHGTLSWEPKLAMMRIAITPTIIFVLLAFLLIERRKGLRESTYLTVDLVPSPLPSDLCSIEENPPHCK